MSVPQDSPETLVSVPNDLEAAMIVSALAAQDIDATTTGGFTAGFRAEAPGEVQVLVRQRDLTKAQRFLREQRVDQLAGAEDGPAPATARGSSSGYLLLWILFLLTAVSLVRWM